MPEDNGKHSEACYSPVTVAAVVGSFAMAVGLVLRISGVPVVFESRLLSIYLENGFSLEAGGQSRWAVLVLLVLTYGTALVLLRVPGFLRRLLLFVSCLVLVVSASPVVALWGIFWSPAVAILCLSWSAVCVVLWGFYHPTRYET